MIKPMIKKICEHVEERTPSNVRTTRQKATYYKGKHVERTGVFLRIASAQTLWIVFTHGGPAIN